VITDADGRPQRVAGLFGALSFDDGETWPVHRLITDGGPDRTMETASNVLITMGRTSAEDAGYLAACQTPNGLIHLVSSRYHYVFNQKWLSTRPPPPFTPAEQRQAQKDRLTRAADDNERADAWFRIGETYLKEQDYAAARGELAKVMGVQDLPGHEREMAQRRGESQLKIGGAFLAEKNHGAALAELAKVIAINGAKPDHKAQAQMDMGSIHMSQKDYPAARADIARILDVKGVSLYNRAHACFLTGNAFHAEGNYPAARAEFAKVLEISVYPFQRGTAQLSIANSFRAEGNHAAARAEYIRVLDMEGAKEGDKKEARAAIDAIDEQLGIPASSGSVPAKTQKP